MGCQFPKPIAAFFKVEYYDHYCLTAHRLTFLEGSTWHQFFEFEFECGGGGGGGGGGLRPVGI